MANTLIYVCQQCGKTMSKWQGKCDSCGAWNSLVEEVARGKSSERIVNSAAATPVSLKDISRSKLTRIITGHLEVDNVLGGGIVPGSLILLGGEPGIGKSTLLLQISAKVSDTLYISGEESLEQISHRADRLKIGANIDILQETDLGVIIATVMQRKPQLVIIDSIQTTIDPDLPGVPGSIVQVRGAAQKFQSLAKNNGIAIILVGHVTKEGTIAGPRTLEHIVDVVLSFEGDAFQSSRILRGVKNRFGATNEVSIFNMSEKGLETVENPSALFLSEHPVAVPGCAVTSIMEGRRPLLVEIQALTVPSGYGYPKRTTVGYDPNRLNIIIAVLQRRVGLKIESTDIYINVVGGIKVQDPGADLAVALAITSAFYNRVINREYILVGEIGLLGEIRPVTKQVDRLKEAKRLGFTKAVLAKSIGEAISRVLPSKENNGV
jgi:DNA repair protein RadA/Sms